MVTRERFQQGMTLSEYIEHMSVNKQRFVEALDRVRIGPTDAQVLTGLPSARRVLVLTEDWCGTCLTEVPFVARLVENRPGLEMRLFPRDTNPDLMDQFLKKGVYRSIPVFAFFDDDMNELARFIETRPR